MPITNDSWVKLLLMSCAFGFCKHTVKIAQMLVNDEGRQDSRISWFANLNCQLVDQMTCDEVLKNFYEDFPQEYIK